MRRCKALFAPVSIRQFGAFERAHESRGLQALTSRPKEENGQDQGYKGFTLLLGWMFAKVKTVAKYREMHNEKGLVTCCIAPTVRESWLWGPSHKKMSTFLSAVQESFTAPVPLVVHMFSGASNILLYHLLAAIEKDTCPFVLRGVIFDSSPPVFSKEPGIEAARILRNQGVLSAPHYYTSVFTGTIVSAIVGQRRREERKEMLQWKTLVTAPQLYLYSAVDTVCPPDIVQCVMQQQRELGASVRERMWSNTPHVSHFVRYPEEYKTEVHRFLDSTFT